MSSAKEKGPLGGPGCLCGSEPSGTLLMMAPSFLSCLCGSEQRMPRPVQHFFFLSCLRSSEPPVFCFCRQITFLSCLYGSEFWCRAKHSKEEFLSCLRGSARSVPLHAPAQGSRDPAPVLGWSKEKARWAGLDLNQARGRTCSTCRSTGSYPSVATESKRPNRHWRLKEFSHRVRRALSCRHP